MRYLCPVFETFNSERELGGFYHCAKPLGAASLFHIDD